MARNQFKVIKALFCWYIVQIITVLKNNHDSHFEILENRPSTVGGCNAPWIKFYVMVKDSIYKIQTHTERERERERYHIDVLSLPLCTHHLMRSSQTTEEEGHVSVSFCLSQMLTSSMGLMCIAAAPGHNVPGKWPTCFETTYLPWAIFRVRYVKIIGYNRI